MKASLIHCPACQREISPEAPNCPGCGQPIQESTESAYQAANRWVLIGLTGVMIVLFLLLLVHFYA
jgi:predicted amidophosphoribosyltransferase